MREGGKRADRKDLSCIYHVIATLYGGTFWANWQRTKILALKFVVDWHPHQTPLQGHLDPATFNPLETVLSFSIANSLSSPSRNHVSTRSQQDRPQQPIETTSF